MNLLLEKRGYFTKNWFIWFLPACTAQSANASSIIWFTRPVELYIHDIHYKKLRLVLGSFFEMLKLGSARRPKSSARLAKIRLGYITNI